MTEGQLQREGGDLEESPGGPGTPEGDIRDAEVTEWHLQGGEMARGAPQSGGGDTGRLQWDRNDTGTLSGARGHSDGFSRGMEMAPGPSWGTGMGDRDLQQGAGDTSGVTGATRTRLGHLQRDGDAAGTPWG